MDPPGSGDFETIIVAQLLDVLPPEYRDHERVRRHPVGMFEHASARRRGILTIQPVLLRQMRHLADSAMPEALDVGVRPADIPA